MKIAVITGSSGELGKALLAEFESSGHRVVGIDLRGDATKGAFYTADLSDPDSIATTFARIRDEIGPVSVLVNNAGVVSGKDFFDISLKDLDLTMDVNFRGAYLASQHAARQMVEAGQGGAIINISSFVANTGTRSVEYASSKAAINAMTKGLAKALAPHGIRVNAVAPGVIDTEMHRNQDPEFRARQIASTYLARAAQPSEVASVVGFLASEKSSFVTGAIVDVNGGMG